MEGAPRATTEAGTKPLLYFGAGLDAVVVAAELVALAFFSGGAEPPFSLSESTLCLAIVALVGGGDGESDHS